MADSGVVNSGHEPNSVQSLLQCPFEKRTLTEKLKVKELGPDQPDLEVCTGFKLKPEPGLYPRSSDPTRAAQLNLEPEPDPNPKSYFFFTKNSQFKINK